VRAISLRLDQDDHNGETRVTQAFDPIATSYDRWYDTLEGRTIFDAELKCLRSLSGRCHGRWLEVGVGTGRFAASLGVAEGIDLSRPMLRIAAGRGIKVCGGQAEALPFPDRSFDGILMVLTLCFVMYPMEALKECRRVLRTEGRLVLGIVPADSPWGRAYVEKASKGHPVYASAHFRTAAEIVGLAEAAGLALLDSASSLFWNPGESPSAEPRIQTGIVSEAGFVGLLFSGLD
jgi:ubiquinone/menaquinone biosynthesis C-methylase UbiE